MVSDDLRHSSGKLELIGETGGGCYRRHSVYDGAFADVGAGVCQGGARGCLPVWSRCMRGRTSGLATRRRPGIDGLEQIGPGTWVWGQDLRSAEPAGGSCVFEQGAGAGRGGGDETRRGYCLGGRLRWESTPASGRGFGTRYTVPTINLAAYKELLPGNGVYVTSMTVGALNGSRR